MLEPAAIVQDADMTRSSFLSLSSAPVTAAGTGARPGKLAKKTTKTS
jgi:hypothetical protein